MSTDNHKNIPHGTDLTDGDYTFKSTGELEGEKPKTHPQADDWRKLASKHLGTKGLTGTLAIFTVTACNLIDRQAKQLKAKDDALESIRANIRRDTTSIQWIEKQAEQGLKG